MVLCQVGDIESGTIYQAKRHNYKEISLEKGEEMGRFNMGSTVVCLFANEQLRIDEAFAPFASIKMRQVFLHQQST